MEDKNSYLKQIYTKNTDMNVFGDLDIFYVEIDGEVGAIPKWLSSIYSSSSQLSCNTNGCSANKSQQPKKLELWFPSFYSGSIEYDNKVYSMLSLNKYDPANLIAPESATAAYVEISTTGKDSFAYVVKGSGVSYPVGTTCVHQNKIGAAYALFAEYHNVAYPDQVAVDIKEATDGNIDSFLIHVSQSPPCGTSASTIGCINGSTTILNPITGETKTMQKVMDTYGLSMYEVLKRGATSSNMDFSHAEGRINYECNLFALGVLQPSDPDFGQTFLWDVYLRDMTANIRKYQTVQFWAQPNANGGWMHEMFETVSDDIGKDRGLWYCDPSQANPACATCVSVGADDPYSVSTRGAFCSLNDYKNLVTDLLMTLPES